MEAAVQFYDLLTIGAMLTAIIIIVIVIVIFYLSIKLRKPSWVPEVEPLLFEVVSGYEPFGEYLRVGVKVISNSKMTALNCSVTIDSIPDALVLEEDKRHQALGNIMPDESQSAIYMLKQMECVDGDVKGTFNYFDASGKRYSLEIPSIPIRNVCPFLTSEWVVVADWMNRLKDGRLDSRSRYFEFKGSSKVTFDLAENRVRHLKLIERDEKAIDGVYCGYCCYFGNAKYGGHYFATTIFVSGGETQGTLTLTAYSNHSDILRGYFHEVLEDVRKHVETLRGLTVITGKCPVDKTELDPALADERGLIRCLHCGYLSVIPPWMRIK